MKITIDTNILISALLKNSKTRELIINYKYDFYIPELVLEEIEKHKSELLKKSKLNSRDFDFLFNLLLHKIIIVPNKKLIKYRKEALNIGKETDIDDTLFFACALYLEGILWSNDKLLKMQNKIIVLNTSEIIDFLSPAQR